MGLSAYKREVRPEGSLDASIAIVGEAPGATEERDGRPFVGQAGKVLEGMLHEVGLTREDCYITNVYKYRPPKNDITCIDENELAASVAQLREELSRSKANIIVLAGNTALNAMLMKTGISFWRGSVLLEDGRKYLPIYHPAAIARNWRDRPITVSDLKKAAEQRHYPEIRRRKRTMYIMPTYDEAIEYLRSIRSGDTVSFDIEVETQQICCIAFAKSATDSMCVPFWFGSSGSFYSAEQEYAIWKELKRILTALSIKKIAQNAVYDMTILEDLYDIKTRGLSFDTMLGFHTLYSELPKALSLLTSLYTDVPYYKFQRKTDDMTEFFRYNCLDALVTFECAEKIRKELQNENMLEFYFEHVHSLIRPLMDMTKTGVRIDNELKKEAKKKYKNDIDSLEERLTELVGHELNTGSHKQMTEWLYGELKLPKQYKRTKGKKRVTADGEALENLYTKYKLEAIKIILDIREKKKILSTYLEVRYDKEETEEGKEVHRARTSYIIHGTETGRLSSRKTVHGTGTNLQNIPKGIARRIFVPDPGRVFINADLSQAEARVVGAISGEHSLCKLFDSGGDIHRKNAANIFKKKEEDVTEKERSLAKKVVHASNYGMGARTFSKQVGITQKEAKDLLNQYFATYPRIKLWHMKIKHVLRKTRVLTTPLGRKRFFFNKWTQSLEKEAYSYIPQSTVADLLNMGLRRVHAWCYGTDTDLLLQIHDAVLLQTPKKKAMKTAKKVKSLLTIPVWIGQRKITIPVDVDVGDNWNAMEKIVF